MLAGWSTAMVAATDPPKPWPATTTGGPLTASPQPIRRGHGQRVQGQGFEAVAGPRRVGKPVAAHVRRDHLRDAAPAGGRPGSRSRRSARSHAAAGAGAPPGARSPEVQSR